MVASASAALAQNIETDAQVVLACLDKVGLDRAARDRADGGCVGLIRGPCLPEVPNTAESIECLSREDAAWVWITDKALSDGKSKVSAQDFTRILRRREAWIKALPQVCQPDEEGSLAYVESEFCEQGEIAKLAVDLLKRTQHQD